MPARERLGSTTRLGGRVEPTGTPAQPTTDSRIRPLTHEGRTVVLIDVSGCSPERARELFVESRKMVATLPAGQGLTLTDVTDVTFDDALVAAVRDSAVVNAPYVKAAAVVGVVGMKKIILNSLIALTRRRLRSFDSRDEALAWLVQE